MKNELSTLLLAAVIVLFALGAITVLTRNFLQHREAAGFLEAPGVITVSTVEKRLGLKVTQPVIDVEVVQYRYTVDGTEYENDLYSFVRRSWNEKDLAEYPVGKEVTVYYDTENPANSVLFRGFDPFFYVSVCLIFPAALYIGFVVPVMGLLEWREKRSRIGFMAYSERDGLKIVKMIAFKPLAVGGLAWFFACLVSCMIAMPLESPSVTIALGIAGLVIGVLTYVIAQSRRGKQIVWIIDPLHGTLDFTDSDAPDGRTTVRLDHLSDLQIRPGRSAYAEFCRKWIDSSIPATVDDLYVVYYDSAGQVRSGKLVSIAGTFRDELEIIRQWLASECRLPLRPATT